MSAAVFAGTPRSTTPRSSRPDPACAAAVELARAAAVEAAGEVVGEHVGVQVDGDRLVTHLFESRQPGYRGWRWAVTVARASRAKAVTVCEVCLLPGAEALLAPAWVPWSERLRPGDLGVGDLLPAAPDDERLSPARSDTDDAGTGAARPAAGAGGAEADPDPDPEPAWWELAVEVGLARPRVMSRIGRLDAAERWYAGEGGPDTAMARQAPGVCAGCAFWLPLAGSLAAMFGVCGNEIAPRDGMVVAADHGCGAHSEGSAAEPPAGLEPATGRG